MYENHAHLITPKLYEFHSYVFFIYIFCCSCSLRHVIFLVKNLQAWYIYIFLHAIFLNLAFQLLNLYMYNKLCSSLQICFCLFASSILIILFRLGIWIMCLSGTTCLSVDCCFSELALWANQSAEKQQIPIFYGLWFDSTPRSSAL
jgi:hypothetical protein